MIEIGFRVAVLKQDGILHSVTKSDNFISPFATVSIPIPIRRPKFSVCYSFLLQLAGISLSSSIGA